MKSARIFTLLVLACAFTAAAFAQFRKPEDAIKYRQGVMQVMDFHFYRQIGSMVNGRIPFDAKAAAESAALLATLAPLPWSAFLSGTDSASTERGKTDAKPAIWTEQAKFKDLGEKMQAQVARLQAASKTGDLEALKTAYRATSNACKACHDAYTSQ
jgi:cytochrome c556